MPRKKATKKPAAGKRVRAKKRTAAKPKKKASGGGSPPTYLREIRFTFRKKRVSAKAPANKPLNSPERVVELFRDLQNETKEKLVAVSLDARMKVITFEVVSIGSLTAVYSRPTESVRASIMVNAYGIIVVHNHPSGDPRPSRSDQLFTEKLSRSCGDLGIVLHDHIIIGDDDYFSFAESGLLIGGRWNPD